MSFKDPVSLTGSSLPGFVGSYAAERSWEAGLIVRARWGPEVFSLSSTSALLMLSVPGLNRWETFAPLAGVIFMHADTWAYVCRRIGSRQLGGNGTPALPPATIFARTPLIVVASVLIGGQHDPFVIPQASMERAARAAVELCRDVVQTALSVSVLSRDFT